MEKKFLIKLMSKDLYLKTIDYNDNNKVYFTDIITNAKLYNSQFEAENELFNEYYVTPYGIYSIIEVYIYL